jgi:hypothetical protein
MISSRLASSPPPIKSGAGSGGGPILRVREVNGYGFPPSRERPKEACTIHPGLQSSLRPPFGSDNLQRDHDAGQHVPAGAVADVPHRCDCRGGLSRNHRCDRAMEMLADMAGGGRPQEATAQRRGRSRRSVGDRSRQGRMNVPFRERVEERQRAYQEIVARGRQSGAEPDQALDRCRCNCRSVTISKRIGQPGFEARNGPACEGRERGPMRDLFVQAKDLAESFPWRLDRCRACDGGTDIGQPDWRLADGPRRRVPRHASVEVEFDRVADDDAPVREESRTAGMQSEIRRAKRSAEVRNQGQGAIADTRLADTDERVA